MHSYHPLTNAYILGELFTFVREQYALYRCSLVHSAWHLSATPHLYRAPQPKSTQKFIETLARSHERRTLRSYGELVREWTVPEQNGNWTQVVAECCPHLERLAISAQATLNETTVEELARRWRYLKSVSVYVSGTDAMLHAVALNCPQLEELVLGACTVTDVGLRDVTRACRSLRKLRLADCYELTDDALRAVAEDCCALTSLVIKSCKCTDDGIIAVADAYATARRDAPAMRRSLHHLHLDSVSCSNESLVALAQSVAWSLEELYLHNMPTISDEVISTFGKLAGPGLRKLSVYMCPRIEGWGVREFGGIRYLSLSSSRCIQFCVLEGICKNCSMVKEFTVDAKIPRTEYNSVIVGAIAHMTNLRKLAMYFGRVITNEDVRMLWDACPRLKVINK